MLFGNKFGKSVVFCAKKWRLALEKGGKVCYNISGMGSFRVLGLHCGGGKIADDPSEKQVYSQES